MIEPDLWAVTLPALRAAREQGREYIESGKYVPQIKVTQYSVNQQGWSTTTAADLFPGKNSPVEWARMFGMAAGRGTQIAYEEVPEIVAAAEWVSGRAASDHKFMERVSLLSGMENDWEKRKRQVQSEYIQFFLMSLIQRAEATGASSDGELASIYSELEKARFADELRGDLMVPIALTALDLSEPFQIASNVWIELIDEPIQRARAASSMFAGRVSAHVVAAASHVVVIRDIRIDNSNLFLRRWRPDTLPEMERVDRVFQCLHVVTGRDTGYAQAIVRPLDWADDWEHDLPPVWKVGEFHRYPDNFDRGGWTEEKVSIPRADLEHLPKVFGSLEVAAPNVQLAARRAMRGVMRVDDEDKTIDATIGIEALLLSNSEREGITYRMAIRAAAALASDGSSPAIVAALVKKVYSHRSAIVHGRAPKDEWIVVGGTSYPAREIAGLLLRLLLVSLLRADEPWTAESLDKSVLDALEKTSE